MSKYQPRKEFTWLYLESDIRQTIKEEAARSRLTEPELLQQIIVDFAQNVRSLPGL